jgi:hypothetical protein
MNKHLDTKRINYEAPKLWFCRTLGSTKPRFVQILESFYLETISVEREREWVCVCC